MSHGHVAHRTVSRNRGSVRAALLPPSSFPSSLSSPSARRHADLPSRFVISHGGGTPWDSPLRLDDLFGSRSLFHSSPLSLSVSLSLSLFSPPFCFCFLHRVRFHNTYVVRVDDLRGELQVDFPIIKFCIFSNFFIRNVTSKPLLSLALRLVYNVSCKYVLERDMLFTRGILLRINFPSF